MVFHELWHFTERISSCNICRSFIETGTCIRKEKFSFLQFHIRLRSRRVMTHCTVCPVRRNRSKTWADKTSHLCAQFIHFIRSTHLCDRHLSNIFFEPLHKANVCHTVLDLGFADIFHFRFILNSLENNFRISHFYFLHIFRNVIVKRIIQSHRVDHKDFVF